MSGVARGVERSAKNDVRFTLEDGVSGPESLQTHRNAVSLGTSLMVVAAIAAECALVVQIKRCYAAVPTFATPAYPEEYALPVVIFWIISASLAAFAIRKYSVARLAAVVAISTVIVLSRLSVPTRTGVFGFVYAVFWPVACFGLCFVAPHLFIRRSGRNDSALLLADSAVVALLTYLFAVEPYVPKM